MKVKDLLGKKNKKITSISPATTVKEAMKLLIANKISCLPVVNDLEKLVGIISDKDIFKAIHENKDVIDSENVSKIMTTDLIIGISEDSINYIAGLMTNNKVRHIPIVENKKITGLISVGDIVKTQMTDIEVENRYLKDFIQGSYPG